ncbi:hypothetical protein GBA52_004886 [Prunus armeniaca]|nr:hypothetical protein GBA52_004886 [Prunus armeniaca]
MNSLPNLRRLDLSFNKLAGSLPKLPPNSLRRIMPVNALLFFSSSLLFGQLATKKESRTSCQISELFIA